MKPSCKPRNLRKPVLPEDPAVTAVQWASFVSESCTSGVTRRSRPFGGLTVHSDCAFCTPKGRLSESNAASDDASRRPLKEVDSGEPSPEHQPQSSASRTETLGCPVNLYLPTGKWAQGAFPPAGPAPEVACAGGDPRVLAEGRNATGAKQGAHKRPSLRDSADSLPE